jgi:RNA polymerase sigma-70 factor (ECF subfamily)
MLDLERRAAPMAWGDTIANERLDDDAFDALVRQSQRRVQRIVQTLVGDADTAATLTQETFLRAYRARDSFRGRARVETWLISIALNVARDHLKSRRQSFWRRLIRGREAAADDGAWTDPGPSIERTLVAREAVDRIPAALRTLSTQQREAFTLRFVEEMSLAEIADVLGVSEGTVKAHLHRATQAVRRRLQEDR